MKNLNDLVGQTGTFTGKGKDGEYTILLNTGEVYMHFPNGTQRIVSKKKAQANELLWNVSATAGIRSWSRKVAPRFEEHTDEERISVAKKIKRQYPGCSTRDIFLYLKGEINEMEEVYYAKI